MKKLALLTIGISTLLLSGCSEYENSAVCVQKHEETRHQDSWTQFIPMTVGKITTLMPIYHAAYDYQVEICDQWK